MAKGRFRETRWFSLTQRELLVLLVAAALALSGVAGVRLARQIWGRAEVTVRGSGAPPQPVRIDVNTAEPYELILLPKIGPTIARAIIEERETNGPFSSLNDLSRVSGIGPKTIESIRPHAMCAPVRETSSPR